jgi:hypothetical protein
LFRGINIEAPSRKLEDAVAHARQFTTEPLRKPAQGSCVDAHARQLHAIEHGGKRQIDVGVDVQYGGLFGLFAQRGNERINGRGRRGQRIRRGLPTARGHVGQRLRGMRGIERVREQHRVVDRAMQRDVHLAQHVEGQLPVVHALGYGGVFKQGAQLRREGQAQGARGVGADSDAEVDFLLRGFRDIEQ